MTTREDSTAPKIDYDLPRFEDWQTTPEWRIQLNANAYIQDLDVGRGGIVKGRISWRTIPGQLDEWQVDGSHLWRLDTSKDPTEAMKSRARDAIFPLLDPPSDDLRLKVAKRLVAHRNARAKDEYKTTNSDTAKLLGRFEDAMSISLGGVFANEETT